MRFVRLYACVCVRVCLCVQWKLPLGVTTTAPIVFTNSGLLLLGDDAGTLHAVGQYVKPSDKE